MLVYNIGISAVQANQTALQTISNNIANANTDGYHRQQVQLVQSNPITKNHLQFGTGVTVANVTRVVNSAADTALALNLSQSEMARAQLSTLQSIEGLFTPDSGSLTSSVSNYFDSVEKLADNPSDGTLRRSVIASAQNVAQQITTLNSGLDQLQQSTASSIRDTVDQINSLTAQISALNKQIKIAQASGVLPNTSLDQRDHLVQELGKLVDISPGSLGSADGVLVAAGGWLVVGDSPQQLTVSRSANGVLQIRVGDRGPVEPVSGQLAGQLSALNQLIPETRNSLQEWTSAFISGVNAVQATGLGTSGGVSSVTGSNVVAQPNVPLNSASTIFPMKSGSLLISVTQASTGLLETHEIKIDPARDSLQDVVNRINAIGNVQASISAAGQIRIAADAGYTIDFAGRPSSVVDRSAMSGTAVPSVTGIVTGNANVNWTVTAESSGQVGSTANLKLRVTDTTTGATIALLDASHQYTTGQPIPIADGLSIKLGPGTLVSGDQFQIQAASDPDSSGFLNAMGIGSLFETNDLRTINVNKAITQDSSLLAASRNGDSGDASQLKRITQLRTSSLLSSGTETVEGRLGTLTSNSGLDVNSYQSLVDHLNSQYDQIRNQQDATSGVDANEELLSMLQFQRSFQANARFISTINDALNDLLGIIR